MRVLLLTDRMESGGAETHVYQLAVDLHRMGHEVFLWSAGGRLAKKLSDMGIPSFFQPPPSRNPLFLFAMRKKLLRLVKQERIEVLHAHTRLTAQLIRGMQKRGCAEVVTVHARFRSNAFFARASYWGKATVAVSEDLRAYTERAFHLPVEQIDVIPNGIDCRRFSPNAHANKRLRVLFASRLDDDCSTGAHLLCRLAPRLCRQYPTLSITIAGGGNQLPALCQKAAQANREIGKEAVVLLGHVNDMPSLFASHEIFVGVSRAAMEAAASGCAVILCGNEGYMGILNETNAPIALLSNFCARGQASASAERLFCDLCTLLDDRTLCACVADEALHFVRNNLDSAHLCQRTVAVYQKAIVQKRTIPILIGGYFGCKNLGDDAILQAILHELRASHPNVRPTVLSGSPMRDRKRLGIKTLHRKNPLTILWHLWRSRLFVLGGGSLLQNRTGNLSLAYYLALLQAARLFCVPSALFASGIGPLLGKSAPRRVQKNLPSVTLIGVRDPHSMQFLHALGIPPKKLSLGADACFLLPLPPRSRALFLRQTQNLSQSAKLLILVLRGGISPSHLSLLSSAILDVCRTLSLTPLFLVLDRKHDLAVSRHAALCLSKIGATCALPASPADALAWFGSATAVLSMRLHGMLLAARCATPSLGLCADSADPKMFAFGMQSGQHVLPMPPRSAQEIKTALVNLIEQRETHSSRLHSLSVEMGKNAKKDLAKLLQIVYNKR